MDPIQKYHDRISAGKILAAHLRPYQKQPNTQVLALPRGGVPVAYEVAKQLHLPLDVFIVRKLGVPGHAELAMGALASGDVKLFNQDILDYLKIDSASINEVIKQEQLELKRRELLYRQNLPPLDVTNKTVILIDDGIATGATIRAAIMALKTLNPQKLVLAIPVAQNTTVKELAELVDEVICPLQPQNLIAVGMWYEDFSQTEDEEVLSLLKKASLSLS